MTNTFHGLILVDKPRGCTSHDVVAKVRKLLGTSVGHAGTLDPIASGLLVLLVGEATKISNYILEADKGYEVKVKLGVETDTLDMTGNIISSKECHLSAELIQSVVESMSGRMDLKVPIFSAIKRDGKTLYKQARAGEHVEAPVKTMHFYDIQMMEMGPSHVVVRLRCSKGSYIRSWAAELGRRLGVGGTVEELRRLWSSPYDVTQAQSLEKLLEMKVDLANNSFVSIDRALPNWPGVYVEGKDLSLMRNGQISQGLRARLRPYYERVKTQKVAPGLKVLSKEDKKLISLVMPHSNEGEFHIGRVFTH